ncbi:MAG: hypothetical protein CM15mV125_020 [uncultured marine virus]|nr:MAG: hypothetical protein CM15mV125_020 [uncultured marine virus]
MGLPFDPPKVTQRSIDRQKGGLVQNLGFSKKLNDTVYPKKYQKGVSHGAIKLMNFFGFKSIPKQVLDSPRPHSMDNTKWICCSTGNSDSPKKKKLTRQGVSKNISNCYRFGNPVAKNTSGL